jgi:SAM-dependent methyltransferase
VSIVSVRTSASKRLGIFFTPPWLAAFVADRLAAVRGGWREGDRVLDPACGDGALLAEVVARKAATLMASNRHPEDVQSAVIRTVRGMDIVAEHVTLCRARLRDTLVCVTGVPLAPGLDFEVTQTDALAGGQPAPISCEIVVANPPYLESKRMLREQKLSLKASFPISTTGAFDLALPFVEYALHALTPGGVLAFILPNKILARYYARSLRSFILDQHRIASIGWLDRTAAFSDAAVYPIVLVVEAGGRNQGAEVEHLVAHGTAPSPDVSPRIERIMAPASLFNLVRDRVIFPPPAGERAWLAPLLERWSQCHPPPLSEVADLHWAVSFHREGLRDKFIFDERGDSAGPWMPFLGGRRFHGNREVERFTIAWDGAWIRFDAEDAARLGNPLPPLGIFLGPKVVFTQYADRMRAAIDRSGHAVKDTFVVATQSQGGWPLEVLAAWLNSDVFHALFRTLFDAAHVGGGFLHFLPGFVGQTPVPRLGPEAVDRLVALVQAREQGAHPVASDAEIESIFQQALARAPYRP